MSFLTPQQLGPIVHKYLAETAKKYGSLMFDTFNLYTIEGDASKMRMTFTYNVKAQDDKPLVKELIIPACDNSDLIAAMEEFKAWIIMAQQVKKYNHSLGIRAILPLLKDLPPMRIK